MPQWSRCLSSRCLDCSRRNHWRPDIGDALRRPELFRAPVVLAGMRFVRGARVAAVMALVVGVVLVAGGVLAPPGAGASSRRSQVLRVRWRLFSDFGPVALWGSGRFVLASFGNGAGTTC